MLIVISQILFGSDSQSTHHAQPQQQGGLNSIDLCPLQLFMAFNFRTQFEAGQGYKPSTAHNSMS